MRRNRRFKSMARASRTVRQLAILLWPAAPWLILSALLFGLGVLGHGAAAGDVDGVLRVAAIAGAVFAPIAAAALERRPARGPSPWAVLITFVLVAVSLGHVFERFVLSRANSFYTSTLVAEGALLLLGLHALQAAMRRLAPVPTTAGPRAADALLDGVRVLLIAFLLFTAVSLRPPAAGAFLIAIAFATIALLLRAPGVVAQLTRHD